METWKHVGCLVVGDWRAGRLCDELPPIELINLLNEMFSVLDDITEKHKLFKVETVGYHNQYVILNVFITNML